MDNICKIFEIIKYAISSRLDALKASIHSQGSDNGGRYNSTFLKELL